MNIAFFITPKKESVCLSCNATMRQALEKMEYHRYSAIPLINDEGQYVATLTEGDLLWMLKNTPGLTFQGTHEIRLRDVPKHMNNRAVSINSDIEDLFNLISNQNFVPVVDDNNIFVGIVTRNAVMTYLYNLASKQQASLNKLAKVTV
ncbi:CBS domain-containing protein [Alkaliphilus hydrothermalis]|uniref:CBS domain-containing protein n=1 Tax=Alkaliphilus hydrothermalis TaxID=1482730 RepID=A0ABS2NR98_9FIRM|nr:CBS domain-containing protein [Alkaliphilus hydrothermalis]MBM7615446.1 CBS domain-containing protein [Alkaliphilus hydrothermalis]